MAAEPNAPADTSMMRIVHQAMRRDLERATTALTRTPPPAAHQRIAIAEQLVWLLEFLHAHHESEDQGLYPAIRARRPDAAPLLDAMHADHQQIAVAVREVDEAARAYAAGDTGDERARLLATVERLQATLLPHLRREEDEAMPVASATITDAEWRAIEDEHNLAGKSFKQLAREGHWLIDEASPEDRARVLGLVPAVPRFILLHGFARSYRRQQAVCWGATDGRRRVQKHGRTDVVVEAPIDAVWAVVEDVTRVGEWSHECRTVTWLGGATAAVPGARFRGRNRQGIFRWGRVCEIVSAEPYELVWRTVPTALYPDSTEWRIALQAVDGGTRIEQTFQVVQAPKVLDVVYALLIPAHRDRSEALRTDLRRLGALGTQVRAQDRRRARGDTRAVSAHTG